MNAKLPMDPGKGKRFAALRQAYPRSHWPAAGFAVAWCTEHLTDRPVIESVSDVAQGLFVAWFGVEFIVAGVLLAYATCRRWQRNLKQGWERINEPTLHIENKTTIIHVPSASSTPGPQYAEHPDGDRVSPHREAESSHGTPDRA
ncbi:hypothetical protein [Nocardia brasiliensis]